MAGCARVGAKDVSGGSSGALALQERGGSTHLQEVRMGVLGGLGNCGRRHGVQHRFLFWQSISDPQDTTSPQRAGAHTTTTASKLPTPVCAKQRLQQHGATGPACLRALRPPAAVGAERAGRALLLLPLRQGLVPSNQRRIHVKLRPAWPPLLLLLVQQQGAQHAGEARRLRACIRVVFVHACMHGCKRVCDLMSVCVRACMRACARACVRACVRACPPSACVRTQAWKLAKLACCRPPSPSPGSTFMAAPPPRPCVSDA